MKALLILVSAIHCAYAVVYYPRIVRVEVNGYVKELMADGLYQAVCTFSQNYCLWCIAKVVANAACTLLHCR